MSVPVSRSRRRKDALADCGAHVWPWPAADLANISLRDLGEIGLEPKLKAALWNKLQTLEDMSGRFV